LYLREQISALTAGAGTSFSGAVVTFPASGGTSTQTSASPAGRLRCDAVCRAASFEVARR